tara:strand:- start:312 stop:515 length:204 start_codon:yes stop_codon:yes gene_type:complete
MTDRTKYRNVSLSHEVHGTLQYLSKVLLPGTKLSISKTVETIANSYQKGINKQELGQFKELNIKNTD